MSSATVGEILHQLQEMGHWMQTGGGIRSGKSRQATLGNLAASQCSERLQHVVPVRDFSHMSGYQACARYFTEVHLIDYHHCYM